MNGWRARIGHIYPLPRPDETDSGGLEFRMAAPKGVDFSSISLPKTPGLSSEIVEAMLSQIEQLARKLVQQARATDVKTTGLDAVMLCGTPLGFIHGFGSDREIMTRLEKVAGVPVTTHISSTVEALRHLHIQKLVVYAPYYPTDISPKLQKFLVESGFDIVGMATDENNPGIVTGAPYTVYRPAKDIFMKSSLADGLLIAGGRVRTFEILEALEHDIGRPVVSSNQAILWDVLRMVNIREQMHGYGQLLSMF